MFLRPEERLTYTGEPAIIPIPTTLSKYMMSMKTIIQGSDAYLWSWNGKIFNI